MDSRLVVYGESENRDGRWRHFDDFCNRRRSRKKKKKKEEKLETVEGGGSNAYPPWGGARRSTDSGCEEGEAWNGGG